MARFSAVPRSVLAAVTALGLAALTPRADACKVVEVELTPTPSLQMVVWLEDSAGNFVDTLFITQATGTYGLGNRPGIFNYNSGDWWPYGRREAVFPIWAHKRNHQYPMLVFQDRQDDNLSHSLSQSSQEQRYCRPTLESEIHANMDMMTCPTLRTYTDKGMFDPTGKKSLYPPRNDLVDPRTPAEGGVDHADAKMFGTLNDLDTVSRPTPPSGLSYRILWNIPEGMAPGAYKVRVEVSKERDRNAGHTYPSPVLQSWGEYGVPSLGQPSVLWEVPIMIDATARKSLALDYAGYGDPMGADGLVSPPDATIASNEGSGAGRLAVASDAGTMYRVKVTTQPTGDSIAPGTPSMLQATEVKADSAKLEFLAPGGDGETGMIAGYEVRMRAGEPIVTEADFTAASLVQVSTDATAPGAKKIITLTGLLPRTNYFIAVRASDGCLNVGPMAVVKITTPEAIVDPTDPGGGCFIATAAFGSLLAPKVTMLRAFRDRVLRRSVFGQTFIQLYYSVSPPFADSIRPYPTLRAMARGGLGPVIEIAEGMLRSE